MNLRNFAHGLSYLALVAASGCAAVRTASQQARFSDAQIAVAETLPPGHLAETATSQSTKSVPAITSRAVEEKSELPVPNEPPIELTMFQEVEQVPEPATEVIIPPDLSPVPDVEMATGGVSLQMLEELALANNPTIQQLTAAANKATSLRDQVNRRPNPTVGYSASQLADRGTDQHVFFVEQEFVRGNKLGLNWSVLNQSAHALMWEAEAQRQRVLTDVRLHYFAAVSAQRQQQAVQEFQAVASTGVDLATRRKEAGETSQVEVLQTQIQLNEVELLQQQLDAQARGAWHQLVAVAGVPEMPYCVLLDELAPADFEYDWQTQYAELLANSPELAAARTRVAEAQALICRQQAQPIPNLITQFGTGYDNGTNSGMINFQVGAPLPVFNDNSGNISAAYAEFCEASQDVRRIELDLQNRLADSAQAYDSALAAVRKYEQSILPNVESSLELSEQAYAAGELQFLQVLVVRRTYFDAQLKYIQSQQLLAQANARITGLLLSGGLEPPRSFDGDDGLRGQSFGGQ